MIVRTTKQIREESIKMIDYGFGEFVLFEKREWVCLSSLQKEIDAFASKLEDAEGSDYGITKWFNDLCKSPEQKCGQMVAESSFSVSGEQAGEEGNSDKVAARTRLSDSTSSPVQNPKYDKNKVYSIDINTHKVIGKSVQKKCTCKVKPVEAKYKRESVCGRCGGAL